MIYSRVNASFFPLVFCRSNNILQSYQPAVQHHLRVLHWGHLSSHDGDLQHVSYLHLNFWFIHRSLARAHWFIHQKSSVPLVNSSSVSPGSARDDSRFRVHFNNPRSPSWNVQYAALMYSSRMYIYWRAVVHSGWHLCVSGLLCHF